MKHRLRILFAAPIAALFITPIVCFASVDPVVAEPEKLGTISAIATVAGLLIKHFVPSDKINKIIPWAGMIGGAILGPTLGTNGSEIVNVVLGGLAGVAPTVGHQLLIKRTPLKNVQVPKWWAEGEKQGL